MGLAALIVWGSIWAVAEAPQSLDFARDKQNSVSVLFAGDIMLDRNVAAWREADPAPMFAGVVDIFNQADYRVANLEGTITTNASIARQNSKILRFTFNPTFAETALKPLHLDAVSLANNHALDFGEFGYDDTTVWLDAHGIKHFGQPYNDSSTIWTTLHTKLGDICFVGYMGVWGGSPTNTVNAIGELRPTCWKVVVFAHWGEEYQPEPEDTTRTIAHRFIDAGADVVIGAHPHVVQPHETYNGHAIFYSLGNFMFDQEFSPEVMKGLMVRVVFSPTKTCFTPIPVAIEHAATRALEPLDTWCLP